MFWWLPSATDKVERKVSLLILSESNDKEVDILNGIHNSYALTSGFAGSICNYLRNKEINHLLALGGLLHLYN